MIAAKQAHAYFEPDSKVVSRTNDECLVDATDKWYLAYGEDSWCGAVKKHVLDEETSVESKLVLILVPTVPRQSCTLHLITCSLSNRSFIIFCTQDLSSISIFEYIF